MFAIMFLDLYWLKARGLSDTILTSLPWFVVVVIFPGQNLNYNKNNKHKTINHNLKSKIINSKNNRKFLHYKNSKA